MDEPPPLGHDVAPNAARVLAAAIGNCLSASLVFCLGKADVAVRDLYTEVDVEVVRNDQKRLRVGKVNVTIHTGLPPDDAALGRCRGTFEDFCIVTESVRRGIDVSVRVT